MSDDFARTYERPSPYAVAMLVNWVAQFARTKDEKKYTMEKLAPICGLSTAQLKRFMRLDTSESDLIAKAERIATRLRKVVLNERPFESEFLPLYTQVYGEDLEDPLTNQPVRLVEVTSHLAMAKVDENYNDLEPLYGLSLLLRPSNDLVPRTRDDEPELVPGWSLSLLNVVPPYIQKGKFHPLFRLRQRGRNDAEFSIEGVIVTRDDRFVFQGLHAKRKLPFNATLHLPEDMTGYRAASPKIPVMAKGVMLGLRASGSPFSSFFEIFAVPRGRLEQDASLLDKQAFNDLYARVMREVGVGNLEETLAKLDKLGVKNPEWLAHRLREMRDRALYSVILSTF